MLRNKSFLFLLVVLLSCQLIQAQELNKELLQVRTYRQQKELHILQEFLQFLRIPNVATDSSNIERNAHFIEQMMKNRGIKNVQLLRAKTKGVPPAVYGDLTFPGAKETLIFYAHYDGQPVNPSLWAKGLNPFTPQLVKGRIEDNAALTLLPTSGTVDPDWRIYARGASDDKGGVIAILTALEAITKSGQTPKYNIKFFFEGEEEQGSNYLHEILEDHKELLKGNLWIICDGPVHQSGSKQIVFGVRGDTHLTLTTFGPKTALHSGHYGNWVPNPVMQLTQLLSSMKDSSGKVTVEGFYDDVIPLNSMELSAMQKVPPVEEELKRKIGFSTEELKGKRLIEAIALPSLNINGIESSNVGTISANIIPTSATAVLDLRLVLGNDWQRQQNKIVAHIKKQGYYVTDKVPTDEERSRYAKIVQVTKGSGYNAQRTPMDLPLAQKVAAAVKGTTKGAVLLIPTLGGSLPLYLFEKHLKTPTLTVPIANPDNNQHSENENIRIGNLWEGIETLAAIMLMK